MFWSCRVQGNHDIELTYACLNIELIPLFIIPISCNQHVGTEEVHISVVQ